MDFTARLQEFGIEQGIALGELLYRVRNDLPSQWHWAHQLALVYYEPFTLGEAVGLYGLPDEHPVGSWVAERIATTPMSQELIALVLGGRRTSPLVGLAWHPEASTDLLLHLLDHSGAEAAVAARPDVCQRPELLQAALTAGGDSQRNVYNVARVAALTDNLDQVLPVFQGLMPWAPEATKEAFVKGLTDADATGQASTVLKALVS